MSIGKIFCITGIDTGIGKTIATGLIAKSYLQNGVDIISQKIVQTGCVGLSEDIICHRQVMGIDVQEIDYSGLTCPYVFSAPYSPHLAAQLEDRQIKCDIIRTATSVLLEQFELVILEGVGGLLVPLNAEYTLLDYLEEERYPLIIVTSARLGSINHTLSALELARHRNIDVVAIIYNRFFTSDKRMEEDSRNIFTEFLQKNGFTARVVDLYPLDAYRNGLKKNELYRKLQLR